MKCRNSGKLLDSTLDLQCYPTSLLLRAGSCSDLKQEFIRHLHKGNDDPGSDAAGQLPPGVVPMSKQHFTSPGFMHRVDLHPTGCLMAVPRIGKVEGTH